MDENIKKNEIDAYYRETPDFSVIKTHYHTVHQIVFVAEGEVQFDIDSKSYKVGKNSVVFVSHLEKHAVNILKSPYKRYVISIKQDFCHLMLKDSPLLSILIQRPSSFVHVIKLNDETSQILTKIFLDLIQEINEKPPFWKERLSSRISDILIYLFRFSYLSFPTNYATNSVKVITGVQNYIVQNSNEEITLDMMADKYFLSKYYLSRMFKEITGYTFRDYLILHRLSVAKDMLMHTTNSVTDICFYSGFNNINHFIRIFKKYENHTPSQFRKYNKP